MKPLISVIITTHNRNDLLRRAVQSILSQTYSKLEIIVVDDGSNPSAEEIIHSIDLPMGMKLSYFRHDTSRGACAARNTGIQASKGEYIIGLDDDDTYRPNRIEKLYNVMSDEYAFVASWTKRISNSNRVHINRIKEDLKIEDFLWKNPG